MSYKNSYFRLLFALSFLLYLPGLLVGQTVNIGTMVITEGTEVSTLFDFDNTQKGDLINDGSFYIYNDWNNDGLVSFTPELESSSTVFQGLYGKQQISGSMPSDFYNIVLDNLTQLPAFELSGDIMISGRAEFKGGIVNGDDFGGLVRFQSGATHRRAGDHSFVDGPVLKVGGEHFVYPTGDNGVFRTVSIANTGEIDNGFEVQYFLQNSDSQFPHLNKEVTIDLINNKEYWVVDQITGDTDLALTLSWDERTTPYTLLEEKTGQELHIVRWDDTNQLWVDEGGVANLDEKIVTASVSGFGIFTLARVLVEEAPKDDLIVYNGVSPNGDGLNDFFYIKGIELFPENSVEIYDRWGVKVYEIKGYDNDASRFDGYSPNKGGYKNDELLPVGTYFYIIKYKGGSATRDLSGYLHINY